MLSLMVVKNVLSADGICVASCIGVASIMSEWKFFGRVGNEASQL